MEINKVIDLVFLYGVEHKRVVNSEVGKKHVANWVMAKIKEIEKKECIIHSYDLNNKCMICGFRL